MLRGDRIRLRARHEPDVAILQTELHDEVLTQMRVHSGPWRPVPPSSTSPYAAADPTDGLAVFSVVELERDELAGNALLWGIDPHNRLAHVGVALRPSFRGRGLGTDVMRVLCRYGFAVRGLNRLQVETLADNAAMIRAATSNGFQVEGALRRAAWVDGEFVDEVILGLLAGAWTAGAGGG